MDFQAEIEHDSADCNAPTLPSQVEEPMDGARYGDGGIPFIPPTQDASNQMGHAPQTPPKQLVPAFHRPVASVSPMSFDCPMSSSDLVTADVPVISVIQDPLARVAYAIMRAVGRDGLN